MRVLYHSRRINATKKAWENPKPFYVKYYSASTTFSIKTVTLGEPSSEEL